MFFKRKTKLVPVELVPEDECLEVLRGEGNNPLVVAITAIALRQMQLHQNNSCEMAQSKDYNHAELTNELGKAEGLNIFLDEMLEIVRRKKAK